MTRYLVLAFTGVTLLFLMGIASCNDDPCIDGCISRPFPPPPQEEQAYDVLPGQSVTLKNPADTTSCLSGSVQTSEGWTLGDSFQLVNPPNGLSASPRLFSQGAATCQAQNTTRCLTATPNVTPLFRQEVAWSYQGPALPGFVPPLCTGKIVVTTVSPLQVSVTANPTTITLGQGPQSSQLQAMVTGGATPYTFSWNLSGSDSTSAAPVARPTFTTTYTVTVRDSVGQTATKSVQVNVLGSGSSFTLTIDDPNPNLCVIPKLPGSSCCFNGVNCSGIFPAGTNVILIAEGNFVAWVGCDSFTRTTCTVVMNADRTVRILPLLKVSASANPTRVTLGQSSQLQATVTGGAAPYSFSWVGFPSNSLDNPTSATPVALPLVTTIYSVTV